MALGGCAVRASAGYPCPNCGATRALTALARGEARHALEFHAFWTLFVLCAAGCLLLWMVSPRHWRRALDGLRSTLGWRAAWIPLAGWLGHWLIH